MALPAQIQRDLDRANALLTPPAEPQVAPPVQAVAQAEATQVYQPAPAPAVPPQSHEDWEHKYRTLQGVHNAHTRDLKARIGELEEHIAQLARRQEAAPATPPPAMNPQDAETFGEDLVEMVRRTAQAEGGSAVKSMQERIAQLEQQLAGATAVASKTADEVFYERLEVLVPDWSTINKDEGFLAWLAEVDPLYDLPRQAALTAAGNSRDVNRVARVFQTYKGAVPATQKPASRPEPTVTPQTSGSGAAQVVQQNAAGQQVITIQAVEAFYKDVQRGLYRGRDQEMAQQEAIINAALAENRIVDARQVPRSM
jgi:polyhydroxyalkanoate synthesis regulator phasin